MEPKEDKSTNLIKINVVITAMPDETYKYMSDPKKKYFNLNEGQKVTQ